MRVAILQFSPQLGKVAKNASRVRNLLSPLIASEQAQQSSETKRPGIDLLILPEMALTGYAFSSVAHIVPYLESCGKGPTSDLAQELSRKLRCHTLVGYPETIQGKHYNSAMLIDSDGTMLHNYRKTHLFQTDESWASEGHGFSSVDVPGLGRCSIGICMDLNPKGFTAPWEAFEFGTFCAKDCVDLIAVPMAWLQTESSEDGAIDPLNLVKYWTSRILPVLRKGRSTVFLACNRTGSEGTVVYAGCSAAIAIGSDGTPTLLGHLAREEGVLVLDL